MTFAASSEATDEGGVGLVRSSGGHEAVPPQRVRKTCSGSQTSTKTFTFTCRIVLMSAAQRDSDVCCSEVYFYVIRGDLWGTAERTEGVVLSTDASNILKYAEMINI